jgi:hypothetical protein
MAATRIPPPPFATPFLDGQFVSNAWQFFITALYNALYGEGFDKVDAGYTAAVAAAPASTEVVAVSGLQLGGPIGGNTALGLYRTMDIVANLPATGNARGDVAYALDGRKPGEGSGAGTGVPVWWSGLNWYAVTSGAVVTS